MHDPAELRTRLARTRLMLLLTPASTERDPASLIELLAPEVDAIQIRPKPIGEASAPAPARETYALARLALERIVSLWDSPSNPSAPLVLVDDRVDVALALWDEGVAGVHLGEDDMPPEKARDLLGPGPLIGLSTHEIEAVVRAEELPVDYLGFGPIAPTQTKGYRRGVGPERAWVASAGSTRPLFPIGGIDETWAEALAPVGRAAVGTAILSAPDPPTAARALRAALQEG